MYEIYSLLNNSNFLVDPNRLMGLLTSSPFSSIAVTPFILSLSFCVCVCAFALLLLLEIWF